MIIENLVLHLPARRSTGWLEEIARLLGTSLPDDVYPLRFGVVAVEGEQATLEVTVVRYAEHDPYAGLLRDVDRRPPRSHTNRHPSAQFRSSQPGLRCEFGGFAGDRARSQTCLPVRSMSS